MADLVTFGELMMRLATPGFQRFAQAPHLELCFGGSEANAAVTTANYGLTSEFVTRLPVNDMAQRAIDELRSLRVGVDHIARGGERIGIYFLETGAGMRGPKVTYDRAHSAMTGIKPGDINWRDVFNGGGKKTRWFHWSGITPAISTGAAKVVEEACKAAKECGAAVSVDVNYRAKLWSGEEAGNVLDKLVRYADTCIVNEEHAKIVFGIKGNPGEIAAKLTERFGFTRVAITSRESIDAGRNIFGAMLYENGIPYVSGKYDIGSVDRVGSGDSFAGGLIFALLRGDDPRRAVEFAVASGCLKHTVQGDYNRITLEEVEAFAQGAGSGRVQR